MRCYLFDDQIILPAQTDDIVARSAELFARERFGLWLARRNDDDPIVGFGAFWSFRDPPELELLYGVADAHVGRGYGREIAAAVVRYGFDVLRMPLIRASTDAAHGRSRRVLDDLGFAFERQAVVAGFDTVFYVARSRHADPGPP